MKMTQSHIVSRVLILNSLTSSFRATSVSLVQLLISVSSALNSNYLNLKLSFSCKNDNICAGVQLYDTCNFNSECYFGMFCNEGGRCVRHKKAGERCSSNEACGRKAMCIFETTLSTYGTCKEILSESDNNLVLPMYKADMSDTDSNLFVYQNDFEKVCRSGFLNVTSGRCTTGLKSKNKGKVCTTNLDCPTTDPLMYA